MLVPCEIVTKHFLPAIRAGITKELAEKHAFTQEDIASKLGITQAAVSKYLSGKYTDGVKTLERDKEIKKTVENIALSIADKKITKLQLTNSVCQSCRQFLNCRGGII